MWKKANRLFWLLLYYGFARFLPRTAFPLFGRSSGKLRNCCAQHLFKKCGKIINIEHMASFGDGSLVELGEESCMGIHCHYPNNVIIGDHVMFGPRCYFIGNKTHNFDRLDIPIGHQGTGTIEKRTVIGDDVWMGRQCLVIPGHKVGSHCVIGAGSVVCKDVPDYSVAGGNPIRVIRDRRQKS